MGPHLHDSDLGECSECASAGVPPERQAAFKDVFVISPELMRVVCRVHKRTWSGPHPRTFYDFRFMRADDYARSRRVYESMGFSIEGCAPSEFPKPKPAVLADRTPIPAGHGAGWFE